METTLNQRIKLFATYKDIGQQGLADAMSVSLNSVNAIVNGRANPRLSTLNKLFETYPDLNRSWLMTGEGEMIKAPGVKPKAEKDGRYASAIDVEMLANEVQMLRQMILKLMGKIENFPISLLPAGKILSIYDGQEVYAGDYGLSKTA